MVNKGSTGLTAIYGPDGKKIAGPLDPNQEGIVIAEIDVEQIIVQKLQHDIAGNYNRFDVISLNLNRRPQKAIWEMPDPEGHGWADSPEMKELKSRVESLAEKIRSIHSQE